VLSVVIIVIHWLSSVFALFCKVVERANPPLLLYMAAIHSDLSF
jgi:hypothetical protein